MISTSIQCEYLVGVTVLPEPGTGTKPVSNLLRHENGPNRRISELLDQWESYKVNRKQFTLLQVL